MSIKEQLFTSFIKSIGKTSGTVTVFGFIGAAWYFYNKSTNYALNKNKVVENEEIILQDVEQQTLAQTDSESGESVLENDKQKKTKSSQNFRRIFDSL